MKKSKIKSQNSLKSYLFCFICLTTFIISYFFKINLSNIFGQTELNAFLFQYKIFTKDGGVVSDLATHWNYIEALRSDLKNLLFFKMGEDTNLINFPLHNIIFSQIYFLADDIRIYLLFFFILSLLLPIILYLNLKETYGEKFKSINIIICSLILILPAFQYSAIWGNNHITALIFFLTATLFHIKLKKTNYENSKYITISILFLAAAAYTKQYYVFFFLFLFLEFFLKLNFKYFFKVSFFTFLLSIPGLLFLYKNPMLFTGLQRETTNFVSSVAISSSICFFYILPFLLQYIINTKYKILEEIKKYFNLKTLILIIIIFILFEFFFSYDDFIGGGVFLKLFFNLLNQKQIFYIISIFGIIFIFYFTEKNAHQYFLSFLIITIFSTGIYIFQKYFEPMFLIIFLLYFDKQKIIKSLNKSNFFLIIYFSSYYLIVNYIYFLNL